ncbi:MAG: DUF6268 family outer membrane beta-barrel protein [Pirellulaceae bacterium]
MNIRTCFCFDRIRLGACVLTALLMLILGGVNPADAQSQPWARQGVTDWQRPQTFQPIQTLPPTDVFPDGMTYRAEDDPTRMRLTTGNLPPEVDQLPENLELRDALVMSEEEVFSTRPKLKPSKDGLLQSLTVQSTWLAGSGDNLGMTEVSASGTIGFPAPTRESPMLITPGYGMYFLVGPDSVSTPATLYQAYVTTLWMPQITEKLGGIFSITPGVYSDFRQTDSDAFRLSGMALGSYRWTNELQFIFGAVYLNRDDFPILPAAGVIWTPTEDHRLELTFPRPRYSQLFRYGPEFEDWWYVGGEFGGGSWAVNHPTRPGERDSLTLSDMRLVIGMENKRSGGGKSFVEIGYVFARKLEYKHDPAHLDMSDTVMIRSGWWY